MEDLLPRIKEIMEWVGLGPASFADEIGIGRPVMSHVVSGRNKASLEVAQKILSRYPEISSSWFLLGIGEMLKELEVLSAPDQATATESDIKDYTSVADKSSGKVQYSSADVEPPFLQEKVATKNLVKVILFYNDGSFESFNS